MPARPDLRQSLGREAVYGAAPPARPDGAGRVNGGEPSWADLHSRATYHLSIHLQNAIAEEAERSGRSKSRVVADALRSYLAAAEPDTERPRRRSGGQRSG